LTVVEFTPWALGEVFAPTVLQDLFAEVTTAFAVDQLERVKASFAHVGFRLGANGAMLLLTREHVVEAVVVETSWRFLLRDTQVLRFVEESSQRALASIVNFSEGVDARGACLVVSAGCAILRALGAVASDGIDEFV